MNHATTEKQEMQSVPFVAYESMAWRAERTNKMLLGVLVGAISLFCTWAAVCLPVGIALSRLDAVKTKGANK